MGDGILFFSGIKTHTAEKKKMEPEITDFVDFDDEVSQNDETYKSIFTANLVGMKTSLNLFKIPSSHT